MTNFRRSLFWLVMLCITALACNDPSNLGSDLVAGDFSDIQFTDTVTVNTLNVRQDSIFTYTNDIASQPLSYLCGNLEDPIFGSSKANLYMDFLLNTTSVSGALDFEGAVFDSLVLSLAYDTLRTYGDTLNPQTLEVFRLQEQMNNAINYYYSDESFATDGMPIGSKDNFLPRPKTKVFANAGDTIRTNGHIRIQLDESLGQELLGYDSLTYANTENFKAAFNGVKISSPIDDSNILGFNLSSSLTYMRLYYTQDTTQKFITYLVGGLSVKFNEFEHDYSGSVAEPFINDQSMSDSLVFPQGMSGLNVKVDFPNIQHLGDVIINKAELEFTMAYLPGDDSLSFYPADLLSLNYLAANGNYLFINDQNLAVAVGDPTAFGGIRFSEDDNGVQIFKYKMSISNYLQDILDCTNPDGSLMPSCLTNGGVNNSLYLQIYLKNQYATRGVMYGAGHSQYPAKLHLTYTKQ